jgi:hypothetical protein
VITNTVFYADGNVNMLGTEYLYRVYAANNVGNSNLSNEASYTGVGINDIETTNVKIFPNPTTDVLNIELGDNEQLERLVIRDVNSSIVRIIETNETRLNVNELSAGNYFLTVETNVSKSVVPFTVLAKN